MMRTILKITLLVSLPAITFGAPMDFPGGMLVESFNNPGFNAMGNTTVAFAGEPAVAGWETDAPDGQLQFGWSGVVSEGRMYGFRFDSSGETSPTAGALGSRTTSVTGPIHYALGLINTSGQVISSFSLSWSAFVAHYRDQSVDKLSLSYGLGETMALASYTELPEGTYIPPAGTGNGNPVAGTAERLSVSVDNLDWQPGQTLWLRWTDHQDEVNTSMGMGIDHLYFRTDVPRAQPYTGWTFDESGITELLVVDQSHSEASDTNPGTTEQPLATIRAAIVKAAGHSSGGKGTRIQVHPGTYREVLDIVSRSGNLPLVIEAVGEGEVVVSGSDIFENWTASSIANVYEHAWTYDFGWEPNPWPGDLALKYSKGTRRELLFINKQPMTQVVDTAELSEGTYLVDDENDRVYLYPPAGIDPAAVTVEISVRPEALYGEDSKMLRVFRVNNVKIKGLVFEHAAAASLANDATIAFRGCSNVVIEDVTVRWSNGFGLSMGGQGDTPAENFLVRNYRSIGSGALGMDGGAMSNILFDGGEIRQTNWRGALWGATGWAPCGFKFASYNGMHMRDFVISQTHASGVWMDSDNRDILFERVYSVNNYRSGFSLEANYGPIILRDCIIYGNSTGINGFDNSGVTVENSLIANNSERQVRFAGSHPLTEEELLQYDEGWSRNRQRARHIPRDWTLTGNLFGSTANAVSDEIFGFGLRTGSYTDGDGNPVFQVFADTYAGDSNEFSVESGQSYPAFRNLLNNPATYSEWVQLVNETNGNWISTESLELALTEAEAVVGEEATGFIGLNAAVPVVTVVAETPVAREEGQVAAVFRITREGGDMAQPILVTFALGGTAQMGSDYATVEQSLLLGPDQASGTVSIVPIADGVAEFEESVELQVSADIDGNYKLGNPATAGVTIADMDSLVPSLVTGEAGIGSGILSVPVVISNPSPSPMELKAGSLSMQYQWTDSASDPEFAYLWQDIRSTGTPVTFNWIGTNNDGLSGAIPLGFEFPFFGGSYSQVHVHSNGFLTFDIPDDPGWRFATETELPEDSNLTAATMVAGFWSNLALDTLSSVRYVAEADRFIVQYSDLYRYGLIGSKPRVTFQVILHATGEIRFLYQDISYTGSARSVGIQGAGKQAGLSLTAQDGLIAEGTAVRMVPPAAWMSAPSGTISLAGNGSAEMELLLFPGSVLRGNYSHVLSLEDAGTGQVLFSLPVQLSVADTGDLITNSADMGDYRWSPWLGFFTDAYLPWIYHWGQGNGLGWIYTLGYAENNLWVYIQSEGEWVWTSRYFHPWAWNAGSGWLWIGG
ncbi:MAG: right-handed parallel beta-helix repeat-containing protein [Oceanipulchritudo sp.]